MRKVDFLIIGGGVAGTTAAQMLRGFAPNSSITIISDENWELYSRILLAKYIKGEIEKDQVFLKKPEWYSENKIELLKNVSAKKLDSASHTVLASNGESYQYSKLLIATGARPIKLNSEGSNLSNIFYMWTMDDADKIRGALAQAKKAVVIGGGFIGLEFVSCFRSKGIEARILDGSEYYWGNRLDPDSSQVLQKVLEANGIEMVVGDLVEKFLPNEIDSSRVGAVVTKSGKTLGVDIVGIGIGIKSDFGWLNGSGIKIGQGIVTNEYLETNLQDVYAAGDCCEYFDVIIEAPHLVGTWANSTLQGSVVARNMFHSASSGQVGQKTIFEAVSTYTVTFFVGASVSFIGMTEEQFVDQVVKRGSVEANKMMQIFVKDYGQAKRIVGAISVNDFAEVTAVTSAIKDRIDVSANLDKLSNLASDLSNLR